MGIIKDKTIWATDYRYLNDSAEVEYFLDAIDSEIEVRLPAERRALGIVVRPHAHAVAAPIVISGSLEQRQSLNENLRRAEEAQQKQKVLDEFRLWVRGKRSNDGSVLVASFIEDGDLLSQWRGYSAFGKGISIGFDAKDLMGAASSASVQIGQCIYDVGNTSQIAAEIIDTVLKLAGTASTEDDFDKAFAKIQTDLFKIAALVKHPKFTEEREWRMILAVQFASSIGMKFREGATYLIPYIPISLPLDGTAPKIQQVFVGPTSTPELSRASIEHYLKSEGVTAKVEQSRIPYRGK